MDFALARLARRDHSTGELSLKLERAGYPVEDIDRTLEFLRARRYLDDSRFALGFARSARDHKSWGPARIEKRLRELRLPEREIEEAVRKSFPAGELEAAERALARFLRRTKPKGDTERERARAYRHLLSRGFSHPIVMELVTGLEFEENETGGSDNLS